MLLMVQKGLRGAFVPQSFAELAMEGLPALMPIREEGLWTRLHVCGVRQHGVVVGYRQGAGLDLERFADRIDAATHCSLNQKQREALGKADSQQQVTAHTIVQRHSWP